MPNWSGLSKNLALWLLVALLAVTLFQLMQKRSGGSELLSYTEFSRQLDAGNIKAVEVYNGKEVRGEFRNELAQGAGRVRNFTVNLPIANSEAILKRLEDAGVAITAKEPKSGIVSILVTMLPWIVIFAIWFVLIRQMQSGGNRAFSFGKSKAKLLSGDTPKITFADVAGADEAKVELQEIIEFLKDPQKFTRLGGRLPKGALLVGPPGTGKTLLAKAVAGEAGRPFFSMSGSDFVEMFVGVGASRVRDLFEQGKAHAPCIIFIDEIDAVGRHRGAGLGGGHDEREQTLNQLLVEMDGFESNDGVILIAATNRPDVLDPALLRPGRFDRRVVVELPTTADREAILRLHARNKPLAPDVDLAELARGTPGFSGADLKNLLNEAAILAAREEGGCLTREHVDEARDKVLLGLEREGLALTERELRMLAYHEAGHAVLAAVLPGADPLHKVTIVPRGRAMGHTVQLPERDRYILDREYMVDRLTVLMGGRAAEELVFRTTTSGTEEDLREAGRLARRMVLDWGMSEALGPMVAEHAAETSWLGDPGWGGRGVSEETAKRADEAVQAILEDAYERALAELTTRREALERVATRLLADEALDGREVLALVVEGSEPVAGGADPREAFAASSDVETAGTSLHPV
jgi:cell division protease FtsH